MRFPTYADQLATWLAGTPQHHGERNGPVSRCVPDFSCCLPDLLSPPAVRLAYVEADSVDREVMVQEFMRRAVESHVSIPGMRKVGH